MSTTNFYQLFRVHARIADVLDQKELGKKLKRLRRRQFGDSIREFEDKSGVSRGSTPGIESGANWPRLDVLEKWLKACGATFAEFFDEDIPGRPYPYAKRFKELHDEFETVLETIGPETSVAVGALHLEFERVAAVRAAEQKKPQEGR